MIEPTKMQNKLICLVKTAVYELENYAKAISDTFEPNNGGES